VTILNNTVDLALAPAGGLATVLTDSHQVCRVGAHLAATLGHEVDSMSDFTDRLQHEATRMKLIDKSGKAKANRAYGKPLDSFTKADGSPVVSEVEYGYSWSEYADVESMQEAKEELTLAQQLKVVNAARKTTARQAANALAIIAAGVIKPTAENDSQIRLKSVFTGIYAKNISKGMSAEDARADARTRAAELLDEAWDDDDDEE